LKNLLDDCVGKLSAAIDTFPWAQRMLYVDWLAQTYYYVRHSTRLLATAAARFPIDSSGDALHHRFAAHMSEEKKHEKLALHDLKQLGAAIDGIHERSSTRMFYEPQYYKIEHQHPVALFGYILALEAIGPARGKQIIERVASAHGRTCISFVSLHTEDDVEHLDKALQIVSGVSAVERDYIEQNLKQSTYAYCTMLRDVLGDRESTHAS
jgi:hypothetical protein